MNAAHTLGALLLAVVFVCEGCAPREFNAAKTQSLGNETRLEVPYFCQHSNAFLPKESSSITSLAMILGHQGKSITPDAIFQEVGKSNSLEALKAAAKRYGFDATLSRSAYVSDMQSEIEAGRPFLLGADFTDESGHFLVVTGYDSKGFWVNDPAGYWDEASFSPQKGYVARGQCPTVTGKGRHYNYRAVVRAFDRGRGSDGTGWVLFLKK
jgi:hypothetical protein